jgi:hypothetical protein
MVSSYAAGQLCDIDAGIISRFLSGDRGLTLATVDRLARGLGLRLVEVAARRRPIRANARPAGTGRGVEAVEDDASDLGDGD